MIKKYLKFFSGISLLIISNIIIIRLAYWLFGVKDKLDSIQL
jgi:hypothetical protein